MAEIAKLMTVSADDIEKFMAVGAGDITKVMGVELSTAIAWAGGRHIGAGHKETASMREIDYKSSTSGGDTADWGDLVYGGYWHRGAGTGVDSTKGLVGSRYGIVSNTDDYDVLTIASLGTIGAGGNLVPDATQGYGASNGTLMFFMGGQISGALTADMDYITIASLGDSADAGDIAGNQRKQGGFTSGDTRGGIFGGTTGNQSSGYIAYATNSVDYIAFHTSNNSADFGDLYTKNYYSSACASKTVWVHKSGGDYTDAGGHTHLTRMDFWAADTGGTAGNFGDIASVGRSTASMADGTRGEFWGGLNTSNAAIDSILYITIASEGDATDAGNLYGGVDRLDHGGFSGAAS